MIQEYFYCMTGTNVYLTPPLVSLHTWTIPNLLSYRLSEEYIGVCVNHTFCNRVKRHVWRIYEQCEIKSPILDVILKPEDSLYFPRDYIYQIIT